MRQYRELDKIRTHDPRSPIESARRPDNALTRGSGRGPESLLDETIDWLVALPEDVRPQKLVLEFPRIANKLSDLWKRPSRCDVYFNQLIIDDRGGRAGFPPAVMKELGTLLAHYAGLYPLRHPAWFGVRKR